MPNQNRVLHNLIHHRQTTYDDKALLLSGQSKSARFLVENMNFLQICVTFCCFFCQSGCLGKYCLYKSEKQGGEGRVGFSIAKNGQGGQDGGFGSSEIV
jgi:hypothetical protein